MQVDSDGSKEAFLRRLVAIPPWKASSMTSIRHVLHHGRRQPRKLSQR
jgi:hypothetical protein